MRNKTVKALVSIRLAPEERDILQRAVDATGLPFSDILRHSIGLLTPFLGPDKTAQAMGYQARSRLRQWNKLANLDRL